MSIEINSEALSSLSIADLYAIKNDMWSYLCIEEYMARANETEIYEIVSSELTKRLKDIFIY